MCVWACVLGVVFRARAADVRPNLFHILMFGHVRHGIRTAITGIDAHNAGLRMGVRGFRTTQREGDIGGHCEIFSLRAPFYPFAALRLTRLDSTGPVELTGSATMSLRGIEREMPELPEFTGASNS